MATVLKIQEFKDEGFALIEDTKGKYLAFKDIDEIEVLPRISFPYGVHSPCALLQSRSSMMT